MTNKVDCEVRGGFPSFNYLTCQVPVILIWMTNIVDCEVRDELKIIFRSHAVSYNMWQPPFLTPTWITCWRIRLDLAGQTLLYSSGDLLKMMGDKCSCQLRADRIYYIQTRTPSSKHCIHHDWYELRFLWHEDFPSWFGISILVLREFIEKSRSLG